MSSADDRRSADAIRTLTRVGALVYVAWLLFLFRQAFFAVRVDRSQLAGLWDQRIERLGFLSLPPNVAVLAIAAACAAGATWLAGPTQEIGLAVLLRITRWSANLLGVFAVAWVISSIVNDAEGPDLAGELAFRSGGLMMAVGVSYLCLAAGRTAPGG